MIHQLHPRLQEFVANNWRGGLTDIQQQAFAPIYQGRDCVIEAPTAGGKTEAVLFPLLTRLAAGKRTGIRVLYIAPLKALLNDLDTRIREYAKKCYLESFKWHGDVSQGDKVKQMNFPSDILLTTPESLEAILLRRGNWAEVFAGLETVVIDEAHYFALTERGSHLMALLERLTFSLSQPVQRVAITATIGNPEGLMRWLQPHRDGVAIKVTSKQQKQKDFLIKFFQDDGSLMPAYLQKEMRGNKSIVFTRSRTQAEALAGRLNEDLVVRTHHSSVSKFMRETAERSIKFKTEGSVDAIISTSTLELGIDIGALNKVFQIDGLASAGSFLQRVGRTGRRDGVPQYFRGLCTDPGELLLLTACVSLGLRGASENVLFPRKAYHILAHQLICLSLQRQGVTAATAWEVLQHAQCFSGIAPTEYDALVAHMLAENYLRKVGGNVLVPGDQAEAEFLKMNYRRLFAIFDTGPMYEVLNGKNIIGTLDTAFAMTLSVPFVFILGGREWQAVHIDHEMQRIKAVENKSGIPPKWHNMGGSDVPFEVAQEVGRVLSSGELLPFLDAEAGKVLRHLRAGVSALGWQPGRWVVDCAGDGGTVILWTFCGDRINRAIAKMLWVLEGVEMNAGYQRLTLVKQPQGSVFDFVLFVAKLKSYSAEEMIELVLNEVNVVWFSKFSSCLPGDIARRAIIEKSMDFEGLVGEVSRVEVVDV